MKNLAARSVIIAIDGFSSCGKSTLAKQIAKALDFMFIDSGAMYRAVTFYFIQNKVDINNLQQVLESLDQIDIYFRNIDGYNTTFLNGVNVESEIRTLKVSGLVSEVSAISVVRKKMVALQREMGEQKSIVMDGRDIGTVVFPNATVKFFITADPVIRAQRRYNELISKNQKADLYEVISNIQHRDSIDSSREDSPLIRADDAFLLDNTNMSIAEQYEHAIQIIDTKLIDLNICH